MRVKASNPHMLIDPFLAFHQCRMLILLSALLVVVYSNINLVEEPRMGQGCPGTVYTFEPYYLHLCGTRQPALTFVIDPFLAFHQCLMLVLLSALLVVVYSNNNLLEEPRTGQGYPGTVYTFEPYYLHL
jgi:uncharacterized membrane protein (DUF106 family)